MGLQATPTSADLLYIVWPDRPCYSSGPLPKIARQVEQCQESQPHGHHATAHGRQLKDGANRFNRGASNAGGGAGRSGIGLPLALLNTYIPVYNREGAMDKPEWETEAGA